MIDDIPNWDNIPGTNMHIISKSTLKEFWQKAESRDAEQPLLTWPVEAQQA